MRQLPCTVLFPSKRGSVTGQLERRARLPVHELHHLAQAPVDGLGLLPAEQGLRGRVDELHVALGIADEHRLHHAGGHGRHPPPRLPLAADPAVPGQGHLDHRVQRPLLERLQHVPVRLGELGLLQGLLVGEGGQVHDGHIEARADATGRLHAVHPPLELDVHEHEVRLQVEDPGHGLLAREGHAGNGIAHALQRILDLQGDHALVLHDHDPRAAHAAPPVAPEGPAQNSRAAAPRKAIPAAMTSSLKSNSGVCRRGHSLAQPEAQHGAGHPLQVVGEVLRAHGAGVGVVPGAGPEVTLHDRAREADHAGVVHEGDVAVLVDERVRAPERRADPGGDPLHRGRRSARAAPRRNT